MGTVPDWIYGYIDSVACGSSTDLETLDSFLNYVTPIEHEPGYLQPGIAAGSKYDPKWNLTLPTYPTFHYSEERKSWVYDGLHFRGGL